MIDLMPQSKAGRTVAYAVTFTLALGAAVFALWDTPNNGSVDGIPVAASAVPRPDGPMEPDRPAPVVVVVPDASAEDVIGAGIMLSDSDSDSDSDDGRWNDGDVTDTGPFIDADDDAVDYAFGPVSDVGEFLDPDAD